MSYVLEDYVETGYVVPYSVTVVGVSRSISISAVNILNVASSIANPLGVSKSRTTNSIPHASSTATPGGLLVKRKLGEVNANVRHPGMSIDFVQFTPPSLAPVVPHNNAGEEIAGLITPYIPPVVPLVNYTGGLGELTHTLPYFSEPTSFIYNQGVDQIWGYEVTTYPGNREINFGIITSDKYLDILIYNKRMDAITLTSANVPEAFGCTIEGMVVGQSIPAHSQATLRITAKLLQGESNVSDFFTILFDKVAINIYVTVFRQPIVVYSLYPDKNSYSESYTYKTGVFESTSKREKRKSMMDKAKRGVSYSITPTTASDATFVENNIYSGLYDIMYQPMWAFASKTTGVVTSSLEIPCDTYSNVFFEGEYAGLYVNEYTVILARITGVQSNKLFVSQEVTLPVGSYVVPLFIGTPEGTSNDYKATTDQSINLKFMEL